MNYKNFDYAEEAIKSIKAGNVEEALENLGYFLEDNGQGEARNILDDILDHLTNIR